MSANDKVLLAADNDRDMLEYLIEGYESQVYVCEQCGHEEPLHTYDLASDLREYLAANPGAPAQQGQGEPVGYVCGSALDAALSGRIGAESIAIRKEPSGYINKPLYTRTDPADVERLRHDIASYLETMAKTCELLGIDLESAKTADGKPSDVLFEHAQALRDELAEWKRRCQYNADTAHHVGSERDTLRAQLDEAQAQRHAVPAMPPSVDRRPYDETDPEGYLEGDGDWCDNNRETVAWLIENHASIRAALSASAEPSAPVDPAAMAERLRSACCQACMSNPCDCAIQDGPVGVNDPCEWSDQQVLDFLGVALRNVDLQGEVRLSEIRQGFQFMRDRVALERKS